jgi:hypothetical protein
MDGPQGRSGQVRKISPPHGFDPRTIQQVASHYTNYTTRPTRLVYALYILELHLQTGHKLTGCHHIKYLQTEIKKKKKKIIFKDIFLSFVRLDIYNITHNGDAAPQSLDMCYRMAPRLCQQIGAMHVEATTMAFPETWYVSLVVSDTSSRVAAAA